MKHKLLYLEDDEALARVTIRALEKRGFEVLHMGSLASFYQDLNQSHIKDLSHALLDLRLDDGSSLNIINELIDACPDIKIVILTGYSSIATTVQAIKLGATNYLPKPATIDEIIKAFDAISLENYSGEEIDEQKTSLKRLEWELIQRVLTDNNGNISASARQLNMHRRTLQRKLHKRPSSW